MTCATLSAAVLAVSAVSAGAAGKPREVGLWIDDTGKGAVRIEVCGNKLCGRIAWLRDRTRKDGSPLVDRLNPNGSLRSRPICGLPVLGNLQQMSEGGFDGGWVYDPKVGKTYSVAIDLMGPNQLKVTGYAGVRFLGKSFIWTRADTDLPSCAADTAAGKSDKGSGESLPWAKN